jgi:hypothetical protein
MTPVEELKNKLVDARSTLVKMMETYDVYNWHNSMKYLNADLTAVMALLQATIHEVDEVTAEHYDILIEYIEEVD